jgi:WD40 repeat protein
LRGVIPLITDFGLAKRVEGDAGLTQTGTIVGTPSYMAPEQARAQKKITTHADVWSLGAILYECLTGRPPFRSATVLDTVLQVLERDPEHPRTIDPKVDADLAVIALKCLEKEPAKRYESAGAMADDLERWLRGEPIVARPARRLERAWKWARRQPAVAALLFAVVLSLILGTVSSTLLALQAQRQAQHAAVQASQAIDARNDADKLRVQEADQRLRAEQLLYANSIALAQSAWHGNEIPGAKKALNDCPPPDRGWEWHFLRRLCETGKLTLGADRGGFTAVAFSLDGKRLAGGSGDEVVIWEFPSGRQVKVLRGTPGRGMMLKIAFSPDGKALAAVRGPLPHLTLEGIARTNGLSEFIVWDLATGKARFSQIGDDPVFDLVFLPNSKQLVTSRAAGGVLVHDALTGKKLTALPNAGSDLALEREGKRLACSNIFKTTLWNTATWTKVGEEAFGGVQALAFGPYTTQLASVELGSGAVRIWDLPKHQVVQSCNAQASPVASLAFIRSRLITGSLDGQVRVWWCQNGRLLRTLRGHSTAVWGMATTEVPGPFGNAALATAGGEIKVWDYQENQEGRSLPGQTFNPSGRVIPVSLFSQQELQRRCADAWLGDTCLAVMRPEKGGPAQIWNASEKKTVRQLEVVIPILSEVAFRPDVGLCAVFARDVPEKKDSPGELSVSDTRTGKKLWSVRLSRPARGLGLSPRGDRLSAGETHPREVHRPIGYKAAQIITKSQVFRVYDATTGTVLWTRNDPVWECEFTGTGTLLLQTGGEDRPTHLRCVDATSGDDVWQMPLEGEIFVQTASRDGSLLALSRAKGSPREIEIFDLRTGKRLTVLKGEGFHEGLFGVPLAFTPDGHRLAVGRPDGSIRLFDPRRGTEVLTLRGHVSPISLLFFTQDGNGLVSNAEDYSSRLWDATPPADGR